MGNLVAFYLTERAELQTLLLLTQLKRELSPLIYFLQVHIPNNVHTYTFYTLVVNTEHMVKRINGHLSE